MDEKELLRGTLDLLILRVLRLEPLHGLGVSRRIERVTRGAFRVKAGSLFPALHRLEDRGWLVSEWGTSENNRRARFYRLTSEGRHRLREEEQTWNRISVAIEHALTAG